MTPPEQLAELLTAARRAGEDFADAWKLVDQALAGAPRAERADWRAALEDTRSDWMAAWERRPATPAQRALVAVAVDPERVALDPRGRAEACEHCDKPLRPPARCGAPAKYCSPRCRRDAYEAHQARVAA